MQIARLVPAVAVAGGPPSPLLSDLPFELFSRIPSGFTRATADAC